MKNTKTPKIKTKKPTPNIKPKAVTPPSPRVILSDANGNVIPIILPNSSGDAYGMDIDTDTLGVGIAMPGGTAEVCRYGISRADNGGTARAGAKGVAVAYEGTATAGDCGMAFTWNGPAHTDMHGTAFSTIGKADVDENGVAVLLMAGSASIGEGGVACALNFEQSGDNTITDPTVGMVSGDIGSVVVAFTLDQNGKRRPVVGFIGDKPDCLDGALNLEIQLLGYGVQFGLKANTPYRLNAKTNQFEEVSLSRRKKK